MVIPIRRAAVPASSLLSSLVVPVLLLLVMSCSAFQQNHHQQLSRFSKINRHNHHHPYFHQKHQSSPSSRRSNPEMFPTATMLRLHSINAQEDDNNSDVVKTAAQEVDRRQMLARSSLSVLYAVAGVATGTATAADGDDGDVKVVRTDPDTGKPIYKTSSGLEYIDLSSKKLRSSTTAVSPRYGQLVGFSYVGYLSLPKDDNKLQKFATQSSTYITKHGNGKLIAGLDEGLHTMKVGQTRRIIIPPKLGFVTSGLGPLPEQPWQRWKLNSLLDQMIAQKGGRLVYDVTLERVLDDEADQGYYEDEEITPEERAELETRLQNSQRSRGGGGGAGTSESSNSDGESTMEGVIAN